ncbi:MAG: DUF1152 domain-containing protein, partial [Desulfurococcales archaeon]|nr:DUF1152 domain-containing protein [Desulfurococcales archaeon]
MPNIVIGGLGGGGDVVLALTLAQTAGIEPHNTIITSFLRCSIQRDRLKDLAVKGALIKLPPGYFKYNKRIFEDKISLLDPRYKGRTYAICTREPWKNMEAAIDYIMTIHKPKVLLHTDLGGDGVILGYEPELGSYKTDIIARALLAHTARKHNVKTLIAAGCVGCEGGGVEISQEWLAATLAYLKARGALIGVTTLTQEPIRKAQQYLKTAESGMLPLFLAACKGKKQARINMAYLHGEYEVKPWYHYIFILDAAKHCQHSPLC